MEGVRLYLQPDWDADRQGEVQKSARNPHIVPKNNMRFLDANNPVFYHHPEKSPKQVFSEEDIKALGPGWSATYIHQENPDADRPEVTRAPVASSVQPLAQELPGRREQSAPRRNARRSPRYEKIDAALRGIAESQPKNHEEVFRALHGRVNTPNAEPFKSAGGWHAGFKKDANTAQAWLSKRWAGLNLPPFARGPK
jgi:hypothetical protein